MVTAETLMMLGKNDPPAPSDLGPGWLTRYPIAQLRREDFTGDPQEDIAMVLRQIEQSP